MEHVTLNYFTGSDPICRIDKEINKNAVNVKENETINMWCTLDFQGIHPPEMVWRKNGELVNRTNTSSHKDRIASSLSVVANCNDQDAIYSWETWYQAGSQKNQTSFPDTSDYVHPWVATRINVVCKHVQSDTKN